LCHENGNNVFTNGWLVHLFLATLSLELRNSLSLQSFKNNYRNNLLDVQQKLRHFIVYHLIHYLLTSYVLFLLTVRLLIRWIFLAFLVIVMLEFNVHCISHFTFLCVLLILLHQFCKNFLDRGPQFYHLPQLFCAMLSK